MCIRDRHNSVSAVTRLKGFAHCAVLVKVKVNTKLLDVQYIKMCIRDSDRTQSSAKIYGLRRLYYRVQKNQAHV